MDVFRLVLFLEYSLLSAAIFYLRRRLVVPGFRGERQALLCAAIPAHAERPALFPVGASRGSRSFPPIRSFCLGNSLRSQLNGTSAEKLRRAVHSGSLRIWYGYCI